MSRDPDSALRLTDGTLGAVGFCGMRAGMPAGTRAGTLRRYLR